MCCDGGWEEVLKGQQLSKDLSGEKELVYTEQENSKYKGSGAGTISSKLSYV